MLKVFIKMMFGTIVILYVYSGQLSRLYDHLTLLSHFKHNSCPYMSIQDEFQNCSTYPSSQILGTNVSKNGPSIISMNTLSIFIVKYLYNHKSQHNSDAFF